MISQARIDASRANGKRSRGPKSEEGKRRSSQNSRRHGLRSNHLDAAAAERFAATLRTFTEQHRPENEIERNFVERMAFYHTRHAIAVEAETELINAEVRSQPDHSPELARKDMPVRVFHALAALLKRDPTLDALHRYASQFDYRYHRAFASLNAAKTSSFRRTNPTAEQHVSAGRTQAAAE
jgi:hypothetical protein